MKSRARSRGVEGIFSALFSVCLRVVSLHECAVEPLWSFPRSAFLKKSALDLFIFILKVCPWDLIISHCGCTGVFYYLLWEIFTILQGMTSFVGWWMKFYHPLSSLLFSSPHLSLALGSQQGKKASISRSVTLSRPPYCAFIHAFHLNPSPQICPVCAGSILCLCCPLPTFLMWSSSCLVCLDLS